MVSTSSTSLHYIKPCLYTSHIYCRNITGSELRKQGLSMVNVCKGLNWGAHGFLTKPILYDKYINTLPLDSNTYVILMDSDTFWSATSIQQIWSAFDCARNNRNIIVSTEMSCWVGRYCTPDDIKRWYSKIYAESYSPFLNSGVIMGLASSVSQMLNFVITNNQSYFITYVKHKFDDQYAIADYAINIAPDQVQLDYHQQLAASCSVHTVGDVEDFGWPFVCKHRNGTLYPSCYDFTAKLTRSSHFRIDEQTCLAHRHLTKTTPELIELETLSLNPIIWHGMSLS